MKKNYGIISIGEEIKSQHYYIKKKKFNEIERISSASRKSQKQHFTGKGFAFSIRNKTKMWTFAIFIDRYTRDSRRDR